MTNQTNPYEQFQPPFHYDDGAIFDTDNTHWVEIVGWVASLEDYDPINIDALGQRIVDLLNRDATQADQVEAEEYQVWRKQQDARQAALDRLMAEVEDLIGKLPKE